jgi:hypothetical protein
VLPTNIRTAWTQATDLNNYQVERINTYLRQEYDGITLDRLDPGDTDDLQFVIEIAQVPGLTGAYIVPGTLDS